MKRFLGLLLFGPFVAVIMALECVLGRGKDYMTVSQPDPQDTELRARRERMYRLKKRRKALLPVMTYVQLKESHGDLLAEDRGFVASWEGGEMIDGFHCPDCYTIAVSGSTEYHQVPIHKVERISYENLR